MSKQFIRRVTSLAVVLLCLGIAIVLYLQHTVDPYKSAWLGTITAKVVYRHGPSDIMIWSRGSSRILSHLEMREGLHQRFIGSDGSKLYGIVTRFSSIGQVIDRWVSCLDVSGVRCRARRVFTAGAGVEPVARFGFVYLPYAYQGTLHILCLDQTGVQVRRTKTLVTVQGSDISQLSMDVSKKGVYAVGLTGCGERRLYLLGKDGRLMRIIDGGRCPAFSHNGLELAYLSGTRNEVTIESLNGSNRRSLPIWLPSSLWYDFMPSLASRPVGCSEVQWSCDDSWLLCHVTYSHTMPRLHATKVQTQKGQWSDLGLEVPYKQWISVGRDWTGDIR